MTTTTSVNEELTAHFESLRDQMPALRARYQAEDYIEVTQFVPSTLHEAALAELERLFREKSKRRDLLIAMSGNTPRRYSNLDRDSIARGSTLIPSIYSSPALIGFLEEVVDEKVLPVPYLPEEYIASRLHQPGDIHGWHWDDYTWALVWIFKMPAEELGGSLEYVKGAPWDQEDPQIDRLVAEGPVQVRHPTAGSAYLLKADTALHRVKPLTVETERMIVCYSYATVADLDRPVNHDSMAALYPESHTLHEG